MATVSFHDQPVLWNVADPARPARIVTLPGYHDFVLWGQAYAPDGRILAAAYTSRLDLWDVTDPARPRRLATLAIEGPAPPHYYGYPGAIAFSPDGRTLALTTSRDRVALWNVASPSRPVRIATLGGHTAPVAAVAFSPVGGLLADVGYDGAVLVFNLADPAHPVRTASGRTVAGGSQQPDGHPDYSDTSYALAFSADGHALTVIASNDPTTLGPIQAPPSTGPVMSRWSLTDTAAGLLALTPSGRTVTLASPP